MMQKTHACDTHDTWAAESCLLAASLNSGPGSKVHFICEDELSVCIAASWLLVLHRAHDFLGVTQQVMSCHVTLRTSFFRSIEILSVGVKPKP